MSSPLRDPFRVLNPAEPDAAFAGQCAFTVMAKAPIPGKVKTRLSPPLTPAQAAALNAEFLRDTFANLGAAARQCPAACVVSYTPAGQEAAFEGILPPDTLLVLQRGDGFGERLLATATDLFRCGFSAVCLIDSDSPTVPTAEFVRAVVTLLPSQLLPSPILPLQLSPSQASDATRKPVVLGRSDDGGYYLLGITEPHARLFADISWSTGAVADETEQRAGELGLELTHLATWYDVDEEATLTRLRMELDGASGMPSGGFAAPHTRLFLRNLNTDADAGEGAAGASEGTGAHGSR